MNAIIATRFEQHRRLLIENTAVSDFIIKKQRILSDRGHIRIKATLIDGGLLEISEHIIMDNGSSAKRRYSFHWQNANNQLIRRWDNADHDHALPHAPHHIHHTDGTVAGNPELPTLTAVLAAIESEIG